MMNGIIPLWKPKGMTSHDCVMKMRGILRNKKVGHTGTLDPDVEGVLPMCVGMATKISSYVTESEKVYKAEVTLGTATETEDQTGSIISEKIVEEINMSDITSVLKSFTGTITQIPPMYSAVRVDGKRLYEYAREGLEVERPKRTVQIYDINLTSEEVSYHDGKASFTIDITCSKGTYIRTLCVDIGKKLGYPSHMSSLVRTASGSFTESESFTFEQIEEARDEQNIHQLLQPLERGVRHLDNLLVEEGKEDQVYHGTVFPKPSKLPDTNPFGMVSQEGKLLAIYQVHPNKPHLIKPVRVFQYE